MSLTASATALFSILMGAAADAGAEFPTRARLATLPKSATIIARVVLFIGFPLPFGRGTESSAPSLNAPKARLAFLFYIFVGADKTDLGHAELLGVGEHSCDRV